MNASDFSSVSPQTENLRTTIEHCREHGCSSDEFFDAKLTVLELHRWGNDRFFVHTFFPVFLEFEVKTVSVVQKIKNVDSRVRTCAGEAQQISSLSP